jgi:hypothetical protein
MSEQQSLIPPERPAEPEDLTPYQKFVKHDRYQNRITVSGTLLIETFIKAAKYMEEIHRKQLQDVDTRLTNNAGRISRTLHHQLAAIICRYMPNIKLADEKLAGELQVAVNEAEKIELLAQQMMDEINQARTRGNVRFVDSVMPAKK